MKYLSLMLAALCLCALAVPCVEAKKPRQAPLPMQGPPVTINDLNTSCPCGTACACEAGRCPSGCPSPQRTIRVLSSTVSAPIVLNPDTPTVVTVPIPPHVTYGNPGGPFLYPNSGIGSTPVMTYSSTPVFTSSYAGGACAVPQGYGGFSPAPAFSGGGFFRGGFRGVRGGGCAGGS